MATTYSLQISKQTTRQDNTKLKGLLRLTSNYVRSVK